MLNSDPRLRQLLAVIWLLDGLFSLKPRMPRCKIRQETSMTSYTLAQFVHISALPAAIVASALGHFADTRMRAAHTSRAKCSRWRCSRS